MKQPIGGLQGIKPRLSKPAGGNGKLSKQEAHKLDREYRIHRNQALQLRNHREQMLLAKSRGELITREKAALEASYLVRSLQQKIWYFPRSVWERDSPNPGSRSESATGGDWRAQESRDRVYGQYPGVATLCGRRLARDAGC
jgi:hypothetical protein